jgi:hypothetical protein
MVLHTEGMKEIFRRRDNITLITTVISESASGTLMGTIYAPGSAWPDACVDLTETGGVVRDGLFRPPPPNPPVNAAPPALC